MRLLFAVALALSACGSPEQAHGQQNAKAIKPVFAIAGISPGQTAAQVLTAARNAGYHIASVSDGPDWALSLKQATSGDQWQMSVPRKSIREHELRRGGESILVSYIAMPQGPVAWSVHYNAPPGVLDLAKATGELTKRYGKSSFGNAAVAEPWAQWCATPAPSARDCLKRSYLTVSESSSGVRIYTADEAIRERQKVLLRQQSGAKPAF